MMWNTKKFSHGIPILKSRRIYFSSEKLLWQSSGRVEEYESLADVICSRQLNKKYFGVGPKGKRSGIDKN